MGKKGKQFVDKKAPGTYSFRLVHRSQRDPLIADEESSKMVLLQTSGPPVAAAAGEGGAAAQAVASFVADGEGAARPGVQGRGEEVAGDVDAVEQRR